MFVVGGSCHDPREGDKLRIVDDLGLGPNQATLLKDRFGKDHGIANVGGRVSQIWGATEQQASEHHRNKCGKRRPTISG